VLIHADFQDPSLFQRDTTCGRLNKNRKLMPSKI